MGWGPDSSEAHHDPGDAGNFRGSGRAMREDEEGDAPRELGLTRAQVMCAY
jgi:hypothetical protein